MNKWLLLGTLSLTTLRADWHEPSASFVTEAKNPFGMPEFHLSLQHQSSFDIKDNSIIILHGLSDAYSYKTFHHELGLGVRQLYENVGFGFNVVYANENSWGFFNHHFIPGLEMFHDHFSLVYNRYIPVKDSVEFGDLEYLFYDVSELTLSYRPSKKYEFSFTPALNHQTKKFGYEGAISAYFFDNWKLSLNPFFNEKSEYGSKFSVGYHFGGPKSVANSELKKNHKFFFTSDKKKVKPFRIYQPVQYLFVPSDPIAVVTESNEGQMEDFEKKEPLTTENHNWWDAIFSPRINTGSK